jgi:hypothetical protein
MKIRFILVFICIMVSLVILCFRVQDDYKILNESGDGLVTDDTLVIGTVNPLVVLYSSSYRDWDMDIAKNSQVAVLDKIAGDRKNCIVGIHYWEQDNKDTPPDVIQELNNKTTISYDTVWDEFNNSKVGDSPNSSWMSNKTRIFKQIFNSTKLAFENAEKLFKETYGYEMPMDQIILRFRPDIIINDVDKFPLPPTNEKYFFMGQWHYAHRPNFDKLNKEIDPIFFYTTKRALLDIFKIDNIDIGIEHDTPWKAKEGESVVPGKFHIFESDLYESIVRAFPDMKIIWTFDSKLMVWKGGPYVFSN